MMFCTPCVVASWPLSGIGSSRAALSADDDGVREPVVRGRDARSILLLVLMSICWKIVPAVWLFQPGTNCCGPLIKVPFL